jgi:hypothetical protein
MYYVNYQVLLHAIYMTDAQRQHDINVRMLLA